MKTFLSIAFVLAVVVASVVAIYEGQHRKFAVGDCIMWQPSGLERWEETGSQVEAVKEIGKNSYRTFYVNSGSESKVWFDQERSYVKVSCPVHVRFQWHFQFREVKP